MVLRMYNIFVLFLLVLLLFFFQLSSANVLLKNKKWKIKYGSHSYVNKRTVIHQKYKLLFLKRNQNDKAKNNDEKDSGEDSDREQDGMDIILLRKNENFENSLCRSNLKKEGLFELVVPIERTSTLAKCYLIDSIGVRGEKQKFGREASEEKTETKVKNKPMDYLDVRKNEKSIDIKKKGSKVAKQKQKKNKITELKEVTKRNEQRAKINWYINEQLLQIMNEIMVLKKKKEKEVNEQGKKKKDSIMKWNFYMTTKEKPLNCFIYFDLPENTILLKPSEIEDTKFLISINALNDIRRNNKDILKNIYFKKYNVTFDYIYKNCNFLTLLVNKILDQPHLLNVGTVTSLLSSLYIFRNALYQICLHFLSSKIMWNYAIYNIWFNMYHTTLPLKLFFLKQAFSYSKMGTDFMSMFLKSRLVKLETYLMNVSLKNKIAVERTPHNKYDETKFQIATAIDTHTEEIEEEEDFLYV